MIRPRHVRIMGRQFRIDYVPEEQLGDETAGLCLLDAQLIKVADNQPVADELDTVIHEIFHAIYYFMGLNPEGEEEEAVVRRLATGLTTVLLENPQLSSYIKQVRKENK